MDAKCPRCNGKAYLDEDKMDLVRCRCGYEASYDDYLEDMKARAMSLLDEYIDRV